MMVLLWALLGVAPTLQVKLGGLHRYGAPVVAYYGVARHGRLPMVAITVHRLGEVRLIVNAHVCHGKMAACPLDLNIDRAIAFDLAIRSLIGGISMSCVVVDGVSTL